MPERVLSIAISSPSTQDSRDDGSVHLRVEDAISGTVLCDVSIPAGRWWRLCQGTQHNYMGFVSGTLEHVGLQSNHEELRVPQEIVKGKYKEEEVTPLIEAWLADGNKPERWESYRLYRHNYGWAAHGTWYTEPTPDELAKFRKDRYVDG